MTLSRDQAFLIGGAVLALAIGFMCSPWSPLAQSAAPEGQQGTTWSPSQPLAPHLARGGLLHPPLAGQGRTGLIKNGWAWISTPPSEVTGPGVTDA